MFVSPLVVIVGAGVGWSGVGTLAVALGLSIELEVGTLAVALGLLSIELEMGTLAVNTI